MTPSLKLRSLAVPLLVATLIGGVGEAGAQQREPNVQLTFRIIEANGFEGVEPEISDVVEELQEIFRFEGYRLLSTSVINTVPFTDFSQRLSSPHGARFHLFGEVAGDQDGDRFHRLAIDLRDANGTFMDGNWIPGPTVLNASVNVRDGQTVVLGSARPTPDAAALILVVTARFSY